MKERIVAVALALVTLVGCGGGEASAPATCLPGCSATRDYDAISYLLRGSFDWEGQKLVAKEDVALKLGASRIVELDSDVAVTAVSAAGKPLAFSRNTAKRTLAVDLNPLDVGDEPVELQIAFEAPVSGSMSAPAPQDNDPVTSRIVYTDSEPNRGLTWLVAKHDPADRALFGLSFTVAADEDVVSNGERIADVASGDTRVVEYRIEQPIPTYLMAFAAGQLERATLETQRVPLAVWYRRGLVVDAEANLQVIAEEMTQLEALVGPYPFARYSVVLVPGLGGGMENATITFNSESSAQGHISAGLHAHELAHQWFGDWVTMRTSDDVWVKEGLATLLESQLDPADARAADGRRLHVQPQRRDRRHVAARVGQVQQRALPASRLVAHPSSGPGR